MSNATGAVIEIVEVRRSAAEGVGDEIVVPNDVRINGQSLLCPADHPVTIHEVGIGAHELVQVTLTLLAKRVVIEQEVAK